MSETEAIYIFVLPALWWSIYRLLVGKKVLSSPSLLFGLMIFLFYCAFPWRDLLVSKTLQTICRIKLNDFHLSPSTTPLYHHWRVPSPAWNSDNMLSTSNVLTYIRPAAGFLISHLFHKYSLKPSTEIFSLCLSDFILTVSGTFCFPEEPSHMWSVWHTRLEKESMRPSSSQLELREKPRPWGRWTSCLTLTMKGSSTSMMPLRRRMLSSSLLRCILFIVLQRRSLSCALSCFNAQFNTTQRYISVNTEFVL